MMTLDPDMSSTLEERIKELVREEVSMVPYNPDWPAMFECEAGFLRRSLPSHLVNRIEHFGSTAVPGMAAKPIIDILVEVTDLEETKKQIVPILTAGGYEYFWRPILDNQPPYYAWFIKRNSEGQRTHHIHMVEADSELWDRLYFRDYLRQFPREAGRYEKLKRSLAELFPRDRVAYTRQKTQYVISATREARSYFTNNRRKREREGMIYHSLSEIYETQSASLQKIKRIVQGLTLAQADFHPPGGGWSIAENLEHVCIVEGQILRLIASLLKKTEEAGKTNPPMLPFEVSLQSVFERSRTEKYKTQDTLLPAGQKTMADSLQTLHDNQIQFQSLRPRLQSVDLAFAVFSHRIFGPLTLGQWLAFVSLHEERHCSQIEAILTRPDFPGTREGFTTGGAFS